MAQDCAFVQNASRASWVVQAWTSLDLDDSYCLLRALDLAQQNGTRAEKVRCYALLLPFIIKHQRSFEYAPIHPSHARHTRAPRGALSRVRALPFSGCRSGRSGPSRF